VRPEVVAILCSDIHLSLRPPAARTGEPDWLEAQKRVLDQLHQLQKEHDIPPPILCAGDVFHKWNSPVELVNWAFMNLPFMSAIPGQHDLPYHSMDLIHRSAFQTLCYHQGEHGIDPVLWERPDEVWGFPGIHAQGFPWGRKLTQAPESDRIKVAVIHQYVWIPGHSYPGAPESSQVHNLFKDGMGWDVIVCGDNHKGFLTKTKTGTVIFNCGGLQRRQTDEVDYHPHVGLLHADGKVRLHFLDISQDIITSSPEVKEQEEDLHLEDFLEQLKGLQGDSLDFQSAVLHAMDDKETSPEVRRVILEAME
jgi:DNA repair exonuclease SbcCD nuclease subunit